MTPALGLLLLFGGLFLLNVVVLAIMFNTDRYLAVAPSMIWCEMSYIRQLPNMLKNLRDAGFETPWPSRATAFGAFAFRWRLRKALNGSSPNTRQFIRQHLGLWAFIQLHQHDLHTHNRKLRSQHARYILADSFDAEERENAVTYLNDCLVAKALDHHARPAPATTEDSVHWLTRLRALNVLLVEQGYEISNYLSELIEWEATGKQSTFDRVSSASRK